MKSPTECRRSRSPEARSSRWADLIWFNREQNEMTTMVSDSVSYLAGRHSFKFGGEITRLQFNTRGASNQRGTISFDGSRNGMIPAHFRATSARARSRTFCSASRIEASIVVGQFGRGYRQIAVAFFGQDSWRATPKLTVNLGLRYDYSAPWTEVNGKLSNLAPNGTLARGGLSPVSTVSTAPTATTSRRASDLRTTSPATGRTVVRAGFSMLYETLLQANSVQQVENNPPYSAFAVTRTPNSVSRRAGLPRHCSICVRWRSRRARSPRWTTTISATPIPCSSTSACSSGSAKAGCWKLAYVGSRGLDLPYSSTPTRFRSGRFPPLSAPRIAQAVAAGQDTTPILSTLRPYPAFDAVTLSRNAAQSTYHSGQIKIETALRARA